MDNLIKRPELIFVILGFIFGLLMMFITPPYMVPDEEAHLLRACEVADGIFYNKTPAENVDCDNYIRQDLPLSRPDLNYQATGYSPVLYTFSALGLNAGKHFGGSVMFYLGRFFNLFVWISLIALAIKITPVFKYMFLFAALLPMSVYEGMSLAADSFNNAFAFLFFAYIFKLIFEKKQVDKSDCLILVFMSLISAFTKGAIYPIFLFFLLPMKKHKYLFASGCLLLAFLLMSYWSSINYTYIYTGLDPEFNKHLLFTNPFHFLYLFAKTVVMNTSFYIRSCIGILGWLDIKLYDPLYLITSIVFISQFVLLPEKKVRDNQRWLSMFVIILYYVFLHIMYYIIWTIPDSLRINGVQGRYFIPVLPFIFLMFAQSNEYFSKKIQYNYKIFLIIYMFLFLSYSCLVLAKHYT